MRHLRSPGTAAQWYGTGSSEVISRIGHIYRGPQYEGAFHLAIERCAELSLPLAAAPKRQSWGKVRR